MQNFEFDFLRPIALFGIHFDGISGENGHPWFVFVLVCFSSQTKSACRQSVKESTIRYNRNQIRRKSRRFFSSYSNLDEAQIV